MSGYPFWRRELGTDGVTFTFTAEQALALARELDKLRPARSEPDMRGTYLQRVDDLAHHLAWDGEFLRERRQRGE